MLKYRDTPFIFSVIYLQPGQAFLVQLQPFVPQKLGREIQDWN